MAIFATTVLLSAALLFAVEPMFTKMVLPLLGGTPAVWNAAVVFFQLVLLAGYAYAHIAPNLLGRRAHLSLHLVLVLLAFAALPFAIHLGAPPTGEATPILWLLGVLALGVGAPFFVLSTTGPLLQRWFAGLGHERSQDPYFLYRASNAGSALGLLAYPLLAEPLLTLHAQAVAWELGYGVFALTAAMVMLAVWRRHGVVAGDHARAVHAAPPSPSLSRARRLRWVLLAAVPSTWMLGLTLYLTTDIAPIPLIWVVPLGLYLLSFNLAFGPRRWLTRQRTAHLLPFLLIATVGTLELHASGPLWFIAPLHLGAFFLGALACHGELAADRPPARNVTEFYLWVAGGGAIGGAISGLIAPLVFPGFVEYPLAIAVGAMLLPAWGRRREGLSVRDLGVAAAIGVVAAAGLVIGALLHASDQASRLLAFGPAAFLAYTVVRHRRRFGLALGAILLVSALPIGTAEPVLFAGRDFYGVSRVTADGSSRGMHILYSGNIVHNEQLVSGPHRDAPLTYYTRQGPAGDVFASLGSRAAHWRVGVIGMGAGALSCYAAPGQQWTFYEIDPLVVRLATDTRYFTYYRDCLGRRGRIILGDGRLSIATAPPHSYDLVVVDAFGSDIIPVNLLTRQAIDLYRSKLRPHGLLLFNISNQYVDLSGVLADLAHAEGMSAWSRDDDALTAQQAAAGAFTSTWMVLAGSIADLGSLTSRPGWSAVPPDGQPVWTDDYSDIIRVIRWQH